MESRHQVRVHESVKGGGEIFWSITFSETRNKTFGNLDLEKDKKKQEHASAP